MTDKQRPEALRLADEVRPSMPHDVLKLWAADARDAIRHQHAGLETLRAGYAAARLEIESLKSQSAAQQPDIENLRKALQFYAGSEHFIKSDGDAWDTVSGEPQNYWCDEAGTATVEDGSIARLALSGQPVQFEDDTPQSEQPGAAYAELPESLILAVDRWFADNTGLGGCSGKDVRELAELFYDVTHEGGRESVDDALAIVESFGPGIGGLNDTYARQILLAEEVKRLRASHGQAPAQPVVPAFTEAQIASACLSYRHDFGLLGETDRKSMMWIARQWERAFAKEREFAAPAQAAPAAVAGAREFPHEQMDVMALARYKVMPSHESMLRRHVVVAGDGSQQLYIGREVECENMARKFAGAFLDGAFAFHSMLAAAPTTQPAPDEIINMAREQGLPETEIEGVFRVNADDLCRVAAAILAARAPADSVTAPAAYSGNIEQELAMLIRRIVSSARRNCEDGSNVLKLANEAWVYLVRKGLNGSPLRDAGIESDPTPAAQAADSVLEDAGGANWQDISTAPKDGTRFVAVGNNYGLYSEMQHTCIAQWFRGCWIEASDWNETSELKYLTHWMPLLPLPGSAARKQGANHENA